MLVETFKFLLGRDGSPSTPLAEISIPAFPGVTWIEVSNSHPWIGRWERRQPVSGEAASAAGVIVTTVSLCLSKPNILVVAAVLSIHGGLCNPTLKAAHQFLQQKCRGKKIPALFLSLEICGVQRRNDWTQGQGNSCPYSAGAPSSLPLSSCPLSVFFHCWGVRDRGSRMQCHLPLLVISYNILFVRKSRESETMQITEI